ncbi:MAG: AAA family ATPase, partial [bacterium]|nr:AAA family ATPase [bacterium]
MSNDMIKEIPYGISDYELIRSENYYYVDKTAFLRTVKKAGRYLFFIRPRRFGKSLFLSMMESYYDISALEKFDSLFKGTDIYNQPTDDKNTYLILKFNFSTVNPALEVLETSFFHNIKGVAQSFIHKYSRYLLQDKESYRKAINESKSASDILLTLVRLCKDSQQKLYVIIDEYDNFANTILSTAGRTAYQKLTRGAGAFRSFFNVIKGGTDGSGAPFSRLFLTGVSPITLDDVTSGYNIGENVSLDSAFNSMLGFTRADIVEMLHYYKSAGLITHNIPYLMEIIDVWYGNYLFSKHTDCREKLYNSDMILYFIKQYFKTQSLPDDLIDRNVRIDYTKLRHLIILDKDNILSTNGNFSILKKIIENGETSAKIKEGFPLEELTNTDNFISLLYFFGLLTVDKVEETKLRLTIPNETIKRLYYDYINKGYRDTSIFDLNLALYSDLIEDMAYKGKWRPFFDYITGRMKESMSLRDLITGEKSIQAFLNVYLGLSNLYIIHTEKEMNKG